MQHTRPLLLLSLFFFFFFGKEREGRSEDEEVWQKALNKRRLAERTRRERGGTVEKWHFSRQCKKREATPPPFTCEQTSEGPRQEKEGHQGRRRKEGDSKLTRLLLRGGDDSRNGRIATL